MTGDTTVDKTQSALAQILKAEFTNGRLREGEIVEARLLKKTTREVFFDWGKFGTGIIYGMELSNAKDIVKNTEIGGAVPAKVVHLDGERGYVELSLAEAGKQRLGLFGQLGRVLGHVAGRDGEQRLVGGKRIGPWRTIHVARWHDWRFARPGGNSAYRITCTFSPNWRKRTLERLGLGGRHLGL